MQPYLWIGQTVYAKPWPNKLFEKERSMPQPSGEPA